MAQAWADFAATGDPGWQPVGSVTGDAVRIWDTSPESGGSGWDDFREPWRAAGLPLRAP